MKDTAGKQTKKIVHRPWWRLPLAIALGIAGLYVLALVAVFFALRWHLTDIPGGVDPRSQQFQAFANSSAASDSDLQLPDVLDRTVAEDQRAERVAICQLDALSTVYPKNTATIINAYKLGAPVSVIRKMLFAVSFYLGPHRTLSDQWHQCDQNAPVTQVHLADLPMPAVPKDAPNIFTWANTEEWGIIVKAFSKDGDSARLAAKKAEVNTRMIVAAGVVEQFRLYFTQRELFEKFFKPLAILGNATKQAMGIMSIKESYATDIENHLIDATSPYYLGKPRSTLLAFTTDKPADERFARLTNEKDHYYSYLYAGLSMAEMITQWQRAGFKIDDRPEILATLFNIGFGHSKPNANPQVGGSSITISDTKYTFGSLAFEFYYSGEMMDQFPYPMR